jgi:predicted kinase
MNVILMSGISGAGKDTYIKERFAQNASTIICSADTFFEKDEGYVFNPSLLPQAHAACVRKFIMNCELAYHRYGNEDRTLIVNNTNLSSEELAPYVAIASAYEHPIELVTVHCQPHIAAARSLHVNAIQVLKNMHDRLMARKLPPFWNLKRTEVNPVPNGR